MILMFAGFFLYIGGKPESVGVAIALTGVFCESFGFLLAYLGINQLSKSDSVDFSAPAMFKAFHP